MNTRKEYREANELFDKAFAHIVAKPEEPDAPPMLAWREFGQRHYLIAGVTFEERLLPIVKAMKP